MFPSTGLSGVWRPLPTLPHPQPDTAPQHTEPSAQAQTFQKVRAAPWLLERLRLCVGS